jgi:hypothetical protein
MVADTSQPVKMESYMNGAKFDCLLFGKST